MRRRTRHRRLGGICKGVTRKLAELPCGEFCCRTLDPCSRRQQAIERIEGRNPLRGRRDGVRVGSIGRMVGPAAAMSSRKVCAGTGSFPRRDSIAISHKLAAEGDTAVGPSDQSAAGEMLGVPKCLAELARRAKTRVRRGPGNPHGLARSRQASPGPAIHAPPGHTMQENAGGCGLRGCHDQRSPPIETATPERATGTCGARRIVRQ